MEMEIWLMIEINTIIYQQAAVALINLQKKKDFFPDTCPILPFSLLFFL